MGWPLLLLYVGFQVVAGVSRVAFIVASSTVIARVPAAVRHGLGSGASRSLFDALLVTGALVLLEQMVAPVQYGLAEVIALKVDDKLRDRVMQASFRPVGIEALEAEGDLRQLPFLVDPSTGPGFTGGAACGGLLALVNRYVTWALGTISVGIAYRWWAAVAVGTSALFMRLGIRSGVRRLGVFEWSFAPQWRRRSYLMDLLATPGPAKEMRVFGLVDWVFSMYKATSLAAVTPVWRMRRRTVLRPYLFSVPVALALYGAVAVGASRAAASGSLSLGHFVFVLQAIAVVALLGDFFYESDHQTLAGIMSYRVLRRLERAATVPASAGTGPQEPVLGPLSQELRFEAVSFAYPGSAQAVLNGLNMAIPAGRSMAVVGLNGAGKTTLVKLLCRLYEPTAGRVTADGTDIRDVPVAQWRRQLGAIFQDFVHYELSLRDNVNFGAPGLAPDDERTRGVLDQAGALQLAEALPEGLGTVLSRRYENGADLSGGQWQRVAIARALMAVQAGATVLVLDEPTANLDVRAEAEFYERFLEETKGLTTVLISHRFSTVRRADRIVVISGGSVAEEGTHDELIALQGLYAAMFHAQARRFGEQIDDDEANEDLAQAEDDEDGQWGS